ncbi:hypothetical protein M7775_19185 [Sporomusa sphaeroides DSM 2875]|uniref:hypothetical protein n=1 Tax=Sporomusa sphaeroides TaxID=47679 RepID=UPI0020301324|nr:hypothetical protein [Sporomusa sphaeroides]MCM0760678.1 hypothetical protein [Sporomusa sphaeroides DSM 2875]
MFPKDKREKLKGKSLKQLNNDIHERDGDKCIIKTCRRNVLPGVKFHHQPFGNKKRDRIECGCTLCPDCHHELHFGEDSRKYIAECEEYLSGLYPAYWLKHFNIGAAYA